jgi:3'-phosphoadenosine 5'-phosphosulfate sulfotransferase (PAPS reductase)/FAD synthetase
VTTSVLDPRITMSTIVASVSGGKDSAAMCLYLRELGLSDVRRVFADTGWEHPDTYAYLRGPLTQKLGPIDEVIGRDGGMENLIRRKQTFPSRLRRFCTEEFKLKPIQAYLDKIAGGGATSCQCGRHSQRRIGRASLRARVGMEPRIRLLGMAPHCEVERAGRD